MKLLKIEDVMAKVCLSKATIYRMMKAGSFPLRIKIGPKAVAWIEKEIDDWILIKAMERC